MTFSLDEVFSSIYRAANTLPIDTFAKSIRFGEHKSRLRGEGHDFDRIVEYDPQAHSVSQIDWRSKDFKGQVYVRESRVTKDFPVIVMADLSSSMLFGIDQQYKERMLLEVVGDIGLAAFHSQDPLGLIGFAENIIFDEEPKVGESHVYYLLSELYEFFQGISSDGKGKLNKLRTNFYEAFSFFLRKHTNKQCFLIVISDFITADDIVGSEILKDIAAQHEVVFIFLDDPTEFSDRGLGHVQLEDMETGKQIVIPRRKLKVIRDRSKFQRKETRRQLNNLGIDSIVLEYGKHFQRLHRFFISRYESLRA